MVWLTSVMTMEELHSQISRFRAERGWDRFHTPKNLILALTGEVGELAAEVQWLRDDQIRDMSPERADAIEQEVADVFIYLLNLCQVLDIDLLEAAARKMEINSLKYPAPQARSGTKPDPLLQK